MRAERARDAAVALALAGGALWEALVGPLGEPGYVGSPLVNAVATALVVVAVAIRRSRPYAFAACVTCATTMLWWQSRGAGQLPFIGYSASLLAGYTLGAHLPRREATVAAAVTLAAWGVPDVIDERAGLPSVHRDAGFFVLVALAVAAGAAVRHLRQQSDALRVALADLAAERAAREAAAAAAERHRIARDMHDVLTHTVSALAVQAGALRLRIGRGREVGAALAMEDAARAAMRELRQLVTMLHDGGPLTPAPGLDDVDALATPLRSTGVDVSIRRGPGLESIPPGPALAAYRIVQECLTNVARHAADVRRVTVDVARVDHHLEVEVEDDGQAAGTWHPGHGIEGMRERLRAYDGHVEAGPHPSGRGWRVRAELPL
ncbi:MAG TPA: histidine kinase [Mycobacteriales bacterium]|nr:histidine kinase [Mycobacteriales bacterium]